MVLDEREQIRKAIDGNRWRFSSTAKHESIVVVRSGKRRKTNKVTNREKCSSHYTALEAAP